MVSSMEWTGPDNYPNDVTVLMTKQSAGSGRTAVGLRVADKSNLGLEGPAYLWWCGLRYMR